MCRGELDELDHHDDDREEDVAAQAEQADPARHAERGPLERVDAGRAPRGAAPAEGYLPGGAVHVRRPPVVVWAIDERLIPRGTEPQEQERGDHPEDQADATANERLLQGDDGPEGRDERGEGE